MSAFDPLQTLAAVEKCYPDLTHLVLRPLVPCQSSLTSMPLGGSMSRALREYYEGRELAERTAAEHAKSDAAHAIQFELAERYASLAQQQGGLSLRFERERLDLVKAEIASGL